MENATTKRKVRLEPEDIAHYAYYKQFDNIIVTMDDYLDFINHVPKRLKAGMIREGFEIAKMMNNSFKTFVLEREGYNKKLFVKEFYNLPLREQKSFVCWGRKNR